MAAPEVQRLAPDRALRTGGDGGAEAHDVGLGMNLEEGRGMRSLLTKNVFFSSPCRDPNTEPQKVRLDPPNLHNGVSNHLLRRYLDP